MSLFAQDLVFRSSAGRRIVIRHEQTYQVDNDGRQLVRRLWESGMKDFIVFTGAMWDYRRVAVPNCEMEGFVSNDSVPDGDTHA